MLSATRYKKVSATWPLFYRGLHATPAISITQNEVSCIEGSWKPECLSCLVPTLLSSVTWILPCGARKQSRCSVMCSDTLQVTAWHHVAIVFIVKVL